MNSQYTKRINDLKAANRRQSMVFIFVFVVQAVLNVYFWRDGQKNSEDLFVPPENPFGMAVDKNGMPYECYVYLFQRNILTHIYNWPDSGLEDFEKNIGTYGYYMGPKALLFFKDQHKLAKSERRLDRKRQPNDADEDPLCKPDLVTRISDGVWEVTTNLEMAESKGTTPIRAPKFSYKFRVKRVPAGPIPKTASGRVTRQNQFGLQLAAPVQAEVRIEEKK